MELKITDAPLFATEFVHPITGITHVCGNEGWVPEAESYPSKDGKRWRITVVPVPEKDRQEFLAQMIKVAKGLTQATGVQVDWHYVVDSGPNMFGDWGWFKVTKE